MRFVRQNKVRGLSLKTSAALIQKHQPSTSNISIQHQQSYVFIVCMLECHYEGKPTKCVFQFQNDRWQHKHFEPELASTNTAMGWIKKSFKRLIGLSWSHNETSICVFCLSGGPEWCGNTAVVLVIQTRDCQSCQLWGKTNPAAEHTLTDFYWGLFTSHMFDFHRFQLEEKWKL